MRELRKKVLMESGKTVSRKARAKPTELGMNSPRTRSSPASSQPGSRPASQPASRAPSRYASEDDLSDSDTNDLLSNSFNSEDGEDVVKDWTDRLKDSINEILDHKRSSTQIRQSYMALFVHLTRHHFADTIVMNQLNDLVPSLLRSVSGSRDTDETVTALKALQMVTMSTLSDTIYDQISASLRRQCEESEEEKVKAESIWTLGAATVFGGGLDECDEVMSFLLGVVESDGHSVEAPDNALVVTAAADVWGVLASFQDDLEFEAEQALEAFTEQLESSDPDVQMAAGTNISLIYETHRIFHEQAEEEHNERERELVEQGKRHRTPYTPEAYNPYSLQHDKHQVFQRLEELSSHIPKSVSRKDKRKIHAHFQSILTSLRRGVGPNYSEAFRQLRASDRDKGMAAGQMEGDCLEFGYRNKLKTPHGDEMTIETWSTYVRVDFLRRVLGGGFMTHWQMNPAFDHCFNS